MIIGKYLVKDIKSTYYRGKNANMDKTGTKIIKCKRFYLVNIYPLKAAHI